MLPRIETGFGATHILAKQENVLRVWQTHVDRYQHIVLEDEASHMRDKLDRVLFGDRLETTEDTQSMTMLRLDAMLSATSYVFGYEFQGRYQDMSYAELLQQTISKDAWDLFDTMWRDYLLIATMKQAIDATHHKDHLPQLIEQVELYNQIYPASIRPYPEIMIRNMTSYAIWRAVDIANNIQTSDKPTRHVAAVALNDRAEVIDTGYRGELPNQALHAEQVLLHKLDNRRKSFLTEFVKAYVDENPQFARDIACSDQGDIYINTGNARLLLNLADNREYRQITAPPFIVGTNLTPCKERSPSKSDILPSLDGCSTLLVNYGVPIVGYSTHDGGESGRGAGLPNLIKGGVLAIQAQHPEAILSGALANYHFGDMRAATDEMVNGDHNSDPNQAQV